MQTQRGVSRLFICSKAAQRRLLHTNDLGAASSSRQHENVLPLTSSPASSSALRQQNAHSMETAQRLRSIVSSCSQIFDGESPLRSHVWRTRLQKAERALGVNNDKRIRIAVIGESVSGTSELVECLLDEPISGGLANTDTVGNKSAFSNEAAMQMLHERNRRRASVHGQHYTVRHSEQLAPGDDATELSIPHPWLRDTNIELIELVDPNPDSSTFDQLYRCDMIYFVIDDLALMARRRYQANLKVDSTLQLLRHFARKPGTRVLVNHITSHAFDKDEYLQGLKAAVGQDALDNLEKQVEGKVSDVLMHVTFSFAFRANEALRSALSGDRNLPDQEGNRTAAWTTFASLYAASNIGHIKASMEGLDPPSGPQAKQVDVQLQSTKYLIMQSLDQALYGISAEIDEVRQAHGAAKVLREEVEAYRIKTAGEIFSLTRKDTLSRVQQRSGDRSTSSDVAITDSDASVEQAFAKRLPWWQILWKVDDVRAEIEAAAQRSFAKETEQRLTFETGKLLSVAEKLHKRTMSIFKLLNPNSSTSYRPLNPLERDNSAFRSAFHSPTLLNELRQYSLDGVERTLQPDLLTRPIESRRRQLLAPGGPLDLLCLHAQRSVLATISIIGTAGFLSIAGAFVGGPFGAGLPSVLAPLAMQAPTAIGSFSLASMFSLWLLQSRWTRAKKRFWNDWARIANGLDADLHNNLDMAFEQIVGAQSLAAAAGLEQLAKKRVTQLESLSDTIEGIAAQAIGSKAARLP